MDFSLMTITCCGSGPFWPSLRTCYAVVMVGLILVASATAIQMARDSAW